MIKICGLRREADIEAVNEIQPDLIGFVFAGKSRRRVTPEQALQFRKMLDPDIRVVGVFTDENPSMIAELLEAGVIDIAQLHGTMPEEEAEAEIRILRGLTEKKLIRALRIETEADIQAANASSADLVLLDHGAGGTGEAFDWRLLDQIRRPFILAGGLDPDNVQDAIRAAGPLLCGVDVSSGVETDGFKDPEKMRRFVNVVINGTRGQSTVPL
ncbi:MAG: phosphoribosylanthranilate isomerase [Lachnospiraceae bacterium]|nr:phosphoribosylanthranilate isomerase [Lachnospiraceae bacterium]